jgi:hypothetical protein
MLPETPTGPTPTDQTPGDGKPPEVDTSLEKLAQLGAAETDAGVVDQQTVLAAKPSEKPTS